MRPIMGRMKGRGVGVLGGWSVKETCRRGQELTMLLIVVVSYAPGSW